MAHASSKKLKSWAQVPVYRRFIEKRDQALDRLHFRAQKELSDVLARDLLRVEQLVTHRYAQIPAQSHFTSLAKRAITQLDHEFERTFEATARDIHRIFIGLRRNAHVLSKAGEVEAIARVYGHKAHVDLSSLHAALDRDTPEVGKLLPRIFLALSRIRRDVLSAVELSRVMEEDLSSAVARVRRAFPGRKPFARPPRHLRPVLREADKREKPEPLSTGFVDNAAWLEMVQDHKTEYVPEWRGPDQEFPREDYPNLKDIGSDDETVYGWEIEQALTHDYVSQVRDGQISGAQDQGIKDFVWIAIVDDKTDECCLWRDGLTTTEIESKLDSQDDDCEGATVPPGHFNCRCGLAPATEELPQAPASNAGEFDDWLNQAA